MKAIKEKKGTESDKEREWERDGHGKQRKKKVKKMKDISQSLILDTRWTLGRKEASPFLTTALR